jgi:hypothetical protein
MNLFDLYEMRDSRDAYERDVDNSRVGMNQQSRADVAGEEEPSGVFAVVIDGRPWKTGSSNEMFGIAERVANKYPNKKVAVKWPTGQLNVIKPGMAEGWKGALAGGLAGAALGSVAPGFGTIPMAALGAYAGHKMGDEGFKDPDAEYKKAQKLKQQQQQNKGVTESDEYSAVTGAITRRIITQHPEVLAKYGPAIVSQAIDEIADFVGDVDEIGSSDVSGWVSQVIRSLGRFAPVKDEGVAEGHTEVKDKEGKVVSWKDDSEWHRAEKNKQGQPKDPRGVVTHLSDVARRKTAAQQGMAEAEVDSDGYSMDHADSGEYDYEGDQAKDQLNTIVRAARKLNGLLDDNENMPEWVQMKITNAADYIDTAADYIESNQEPELAEGDRVGNMDADKFDAAMARLKQLAGAGPLKTVYDKEKRVYRNIPTAVQPKK